MEAVAARPQTQSNPIVANGIKALLAILTLAFLGIVSYNLRDPGIHEGDLAPQFTLTSDQGRQLSTSNFGGKVLVLNFWATWCQPCLTEIPSLNAFQRSFRDKGVVVLGVSIDKNEAKYKRFRQRFHLAFDTFRDPATTISTQYGTFQYPETYVIKDGKVVRKFVADQNWTSDDIKQYVQTLL